MQAPSLTYDSETDSKRMLWLVSGVRGGKLRYEKASNARNALKHEMDKFVSWQEVQDMILKTPIGVVEEVFRAGFHSCSNFTDQAGEDQAWAAWLKGLGK